MFFLNCTNYWPLEVQQVGTQEESTCMLLASVLYFPLPHADVFDKTLTSMFLTMFEKYHNILLTMHIGDVFQAIKKTYFFKCEIEDYLSKLK